MQEISYEVGKCSLLSAGYRLHFIFPFTCNLVFPSASTCLYVNLCLKLGEMNFSVVLPQTCLTALCQRKQRTEVKPAKWGIYVSRRQKAGALVCNNAGCENVWLVKPGAHKASGFP